MKPECLNLPQQRDDEQARDAPAPVGVKTLA
jgi:hypothetical protein